MELPDILKHPELVCGIPYAAICQMVEQIYEAGLDDKERSTTFCGSKKHGVLAFPQQIGLEPMVGLAKCPKNTEKLGGFHTHPPTYNMKGAGDWDADVHNKYRVSCVGAHTVEEYDSDIVLHYSIECHNFNIEHPKYREFHKRFEPIGKEAHEFQNQLLLTLIREQRVATEDEFLQAEEYRRKVDSLIEEAMREGIIEQCRPYNRPDIKSTLEVVKE